MRSLAMQFAAAGLLVALLPGAGAQEQPPQTVASSIGELEVERLTTLEFPWGMALLPDGRLLITEKPGRLRIWDGGELSEPLDGVPDVVYRGPPEQGGLLDVALDPDFASNGLVYLSYVEAAEQQPETIGETGDARFGGFLDLSDDIVRGGAVARARLENERLQDMEVIWRQQPKTLGRGHFGHRLVFAPDGTLFITSGDRMRFDPAQSLASNLGKVVRINPDGSIPQDNPFVDESDALDDIWSYGHRNMLATAIDPATERLWVFEMGPLGGDEVNLVERGANYGWPTVSNGSHYNGQTIPAHPSTDEFQDPVRSWTPVVSPSGALFYGGALFPEWDGDVLIGGLSSQALVRLSLDGDGVAVEERIDMGRRIRDVVEAPDGAILAIVDASNGDLLRLTPTNAEARAGNRIRLETPRPDAEIASPLLVEGEARGIWYFEADFPVLLTDWDGRIIAEHYAVAGDEWMTEQLVPFSTELEFESPYAPGDPDFMRNGTLILQRANPSGLSENDAALEVPVRFAAP